MVMFYQPYMDENLFKEQVGREPVDDELERCNCQEVGRVGHQLCGWCMDHKIPRFVCGCRVKKETSKAHDRN